MKKITKAHACILTLYFETYGFKYIKTIASKEIEARDDGL